MKKRTRKARRMHKHKDPGGIFVGAGVLTGMGVGFLVNNVPAGLFIGLGIGLAIMALIELLGKK